MLKTGHSSASASTDGGGGVADDGSRTGLRSEPEGHDTRSHDYNQDDTASRSRRETGHVHADGQSSAGSVSTICTNSRSNDALSESFVALNRDMSQERLCFQLLARAYRDYLAGDEVDDECVQRKAAATEQGGDALCHAGTVNRGGAETETAATAFDRCGGDSASLNRELAREFDMYNYMTKAEIRQCEMTRNMIDVEVKQLESTAVLVCGLQERKDQYLRVYEQWKEHVRSLREEHAKFVHRCVRWVQREPVAYIHRTSTIRVQGFIYTRNMRAWVHSFIFCTYIIHNT